MVNAHASGAGAVGAEVSGIDDPPVEERKAALRRELAARRRALPAEERARRAAEAGARLASLAEVRTARTIAAYLTGGGEIDPWPGLAALAKAGARIAYPRTIDSPAGLEFRVPDGAAEVRPGRMGVLEPAPGAALVEADAIDVFVVPGVAFDQRRHRLGRGGGHYDRLLAAVRAAGRRAAAIGLAYDFQVVAVCPVAPHDVPLDRVVTDRRIF